MAVASNIAPITADIAAIRAPIHSVMPKVATVVGPV
jgi:hypothetical protein